MNNLDTIEDSLELIETRLEFIEDALEAVNFSRWLNSCEQLKTIEAYKFIRRDIESLHSLVLWLQNEEIAQKQYGKLLIAQLFTHPKLLALSEKINPKIIANSTPDISLPWSYKKQYRPYEQFLVQLRTVQKELKSYPILYAHYQKAFAAADLSSLIDSIMVLDKSISTDVDELGLQLLQEQGHTNLLANTTLAEAHDKVALTTEFLLRKVYFNLNEQAPSIASTRIETSAIQSNESYQPSLNKALKTSPRQNASSYHPAPTRALGSSPTPKKSSSLTTALINQELKSTFKNPAGFLGKHTAPPLTNSLFARLAEKISQHKEKSAQLKQQLRVIEHKLNSIEKKLKRNQAKSQALTAQLQQQYKLYDLTQHTQLTSAERWLSQEKNSRLQLIAQAVVKKLYPTLAQRTAIKQSLIAANKEVMISASNHSQMLEKYQITIDHEKILHLQEDILNLFKNFTSTNLAETTLIQAIHALHTQHPTQSEESLFKRLQGLAKPLLNTLQQEQLEQAWKRYCSIPASERAHFVFQLTAREKQLTTQTLAEHPRAEPQSKDIVDMNPSPLLRLY